MKILNKQYEAKTTIFKGDAVAFCRHCCTPIKFTFDEVQTGYREEKVLANRKSLFDYTPATALTCVKYLKCPSCSKKALYWKKQYIVRAKEKDCPTVESAKQLADKEFSAFLFVNHWDGKTLDCERI